jgi:hypothetical protein
LQGLNVGDLDTADGNHGHSRAFGDRPDKFHAPRVFGRMGRRIKDVPGKNPIGPTRCRAMHTLPDAQPGRNTPHVVDPKRPLTNLYTTSTDSQRDVQTVIDDQ